jgi:hypothetical protein
VVPGEANRITSATAATLPTRQMSMSFSA